MMFGGYFIVMSIWVLQIFCTLMFISLPAIKEVAEEVFYVFSLYLSTFCIETYINLIF